ncbi:DUF2809 domain-containing protein [Aurantibacter sp.]|uniref:ribosomal maturation YjgA family protein n=1 Tax=Aurantibacter sp. TaxID=2807103 RepID=UPI003267918E
MKTTYNNTYFFAFIVLFAIEILIAATLKDGFIRHTVGDFIVVILLYYFFKSFLNIKSITIALVTLIFAYIIEFLQLTDFLNLIGLKHNKWANLIFGNTFSIQDLIAYTFGIVFAFFTDCFLIKFKSSKNLIG